MIIFFTVIAVSIDAYLASLAYNLKRRLTFFEVLYAASFTFIVSVAALTINAAFAGKLAFIKEIGAAIFIFLGAKNYIGSFQKSPLILEKPPRELWLLGLAVSADAGLACLTLEVSGVFVPIYAFYMFAAHFAFLLLGTLTVRLVRVMTEISRHSGVCLIALGLLKIFM